MVCIYLAIEYHYAVIKVMVFHCGSGVELSYRRINSVKQRFQIRYIYPVYMDCETYGMCYSGITRYVGWSD